MTGWHPQPLASRSNPFAHDVGPTAMHASDPIAGRVPGPHDGGDAKSSHVPSARGRSSAAHAPAAGGGIAPSSGASPHAAAATERKKKKGTRALTAPLNL
jgi:hypothetical protein